MIYASKNIIEQFREHAGDCYPEECCGIFECKRDEDDLIIIKIYPTKNISRHKKTGAQLPKHTFKQFTRKAAAQKRKGVLFGVYHSHPVTGTLALSDQDVFSASLFKLFRLQIILGIKKDQSIQKAFWENKEDQTWKKHKIIQRNK